MKIQVETLSPIERKVTIEVDAARVAKELEKAYGSLSRRVKLRGFRPGKAPRKVLERQFKAEVEGEVTERIVQETFAEAVRVESLPVVAAPSVSINEAVAEGKGFAFSARVEVKPAVSPKDYKGLVVTRKPPLVTDETVEAEVTKIRENLAQLSPIEDRTVAQEGDWAVVDHEGTIDGQPFDGGKAEGVTVRVAPGPITEGNLGLLAGKSIGDLVEFDEPFPADARDESLRGKLAHMKVTLKGLKARPLPALDDALAKQVGLEGVETLDALRARIKSDLEKRETRRAESELKDALVKAALAKNDFEVPPALVERAIDQMLDSAMERFARQGLQVQDLGLDFGKMRADLREQALLQVRGALLLEAIGEAEKVQVTDEDVNAEVARIAEELHLPLAQVQAQTRSAAARDALKNRLLEEKAFAVLSASAQIQAP